MSITRAVVGCCVVLLGGVPLAGCSDDGASGDEPDPAGETTSGSDFRPPAGKVSFDFRLGGERPHPAIDAYVAWQEATTSSLRARELAPEVRTGAAPTVVRTVERSVETVRERDYTVAKQMIGRLESITRTPDAAILKVCLWSPTFDYRLRPSGRRASSESAHWMGAEVRMSRVSGHDRHWRVSGLAARRNCEGSKP